LNVEHFMKKRLDFTPSSDTVDEDVSLDNASLLVNKQLERESKTDIQIYKQISRYYY